MRNALLRIVEDEKRVVVDEKRVVVDEKRVVEDEKRVVGGCPITLHTYKVAHGPRPCPP
jgi:hypothetical protein